MRLLLPVIAVGLVIYGVLTVNLACVLLGAALMLLTSGRLGQGGVEEAGRLTAWVRRSLDISSLLLLLGLLGAGLAAWLSRQDPYSLNSVFIWLAALALALAAGPVHDRAAARRAGVGSSHRRWARLGWSRGDWLLAGVLLLVALVLRLYELSALLPPMHGDEGEMGMLARLAGYGPASGIAPLPLQPFGTAFLDHPALFHFVQSAALALFGDNIVGLRTLSVVFGALCAPALYAIGRVGWGRAAGFTAGWLLAVSHLHIHYSRIALNNIETVWFVALLILLLMLAYELSSPALRRAGYAAEGAGADADEANRMGLAGDGAAERAVDKGDAGEQERQVGEEVQTAPLTIFILIGLVIGLGQYFYYGSRLLPVLAVILFGVLWLQKRVRPWQIAAAVTATVVAYLPLAVFYSYNVIPFVNRLSGVSVFTPAGMAHSLGPDAQWPNDLLRLLWEQINANLLFFVQKGDRSSFYLADIPAFDPLTVVLFWLGLGLVLANIRRFHELALAVWWGVGIFLAGVITNDAPNGPRLIVAVPAVYAVAGVFVQKLAGLADSLWPRRRRGLAIGGIGLFAAVTLALNFNIYFVRYQQLQPKLAPVEIAHEIAAAKGKARAYLLGEPNLRVGHGVIRFIAFGAEPHDLVTPGDLAPALASLPAGEDVLVLALSNHLADLAQIERQFPGGVSEEHDDGRGNLLYKTYRIQSASLPSE